MEKAKKNRRTTTLERFGNDDYVVTWWDGSVNHYKNFFDALNTVQLDFEENEE